MNTKRLLLPALLSGLLFTAAGSVSAQGNALDDQVRTRAAAVEQKMIQWRRDIHQHPELGGQETRTAKLVADHLRKLGLEVRTEVGSTGVVGILRGGKPGKTVALRADMDALPVQEPAGLPFASKATGKYLGKEVPVMHACGHDAHTAMLMATAEVLAGMRESLPGNVMFLFQPAEEGPSLFTPGEGKSWGAKLMLEEGAFKPLKPDAVFAVHVMPGPSGQLSWRSGATTAASDTLDITVSGKQGHGGMPWNTIDPIVTSAMVVSGLQTVVSRQANLTLSPAVVTVGMINGGSGPNVIPESVALSGTVRSYDESVRKQLREDIKQSAQNIAASTGAEAKVAIQPMYSTTVNNDKLVARMEPVLRRAADGKVAQAGLVGASEDFSFFAQETPGLYMFLGVTPKGQDPAKAAPNHNPRFFVDESALVVGVRAMSMAAADFLAGQGQGGAAAKGAAR
jgi:amidohydrolase